MTIEGNYILVEEVFKLHRECVQCPYCSSVKDILSYGAVRVVNETSECQVLAAKLPPENCPGLAAKLFDQRFDKDQES